MVVVVVNLVITLSTDRRRCFSLDMAVYDPSSFHSPIQWLPLRNDLCASQPSAEARLHRLLPSFAVTKHAKRSSVRKEKFILAHDSGETIVTGPAFRWGRNLFTSA